MNLHGQIMNLRCDADGQEPEDLLAYKTGHLDARHAAAELALKADACIKVLRDIVEQQRTMGFDGSPSDELMQQACEALSALNS